MILFLDISEETLKEPIYVVSSRPSLIPSTVIIVKTIILPSIEPILNPIKIPYSYSSYTPSDDT